jgi:hypothetical protein
MAVAIFLDETGAFQGMTNEVKDRDLAATRMAAVIDPHLYHEC